MYQVGVTHLLNRVNAKDLREAASAAKAAKEATPVITTNTEKEKPVPLALEVVKNLTPKVERVDVVQTTFIPPPLLPGRKVPNVNKNASLSTPLKTKTSQKKVVPQPAAKPLSAVVANAAPVVAPKSGDTIAGIRIPAALRPFIPDRLVEKNYDYFLIAQKYEKLYKLPEGTMSLILRNEAPQDRNGRFQPTLRGGHNGVYLGLYQFYPKPFAPNGNAYSWEGARQFAAKLGRRISGLSMWHNAEEATHAAAAYAAKNLESIARNVRTQAVIRPVELYIAHQQGGMAVTNMMLDGFLTVRGKQSTKSIQLFEAFGIDIMYKSKDGKLSRTYKS